MEIYQVLKTLLNIVELRLNLLKKGMIFKNVDKILIPGVGSFSEFRKNLNNKHIFEDLLVNVENPP